ncbi:hypothetical protein NPIL_393171 [Nephila pilipes]|uniref:Uncharacterized protein n=1 Tax=Nephila pilipes TaxID=299642 RepID=A0A8X6MMC9_NEPPI|nr:hypothetical protein NPIL_393171 [Nephila pilipes]
MVPLRIALGIANCHTMECGNRSEKNTLSPAFVPSVNRGVITSSNPSFVSQSSTFLGVDGFVGDIHQGGVTWPTTKKKEKWELNVE